MLVYKKTRYVLNLMADEIKSEWDKVLGSNRHTLNIEFTIYRSNIRMYITAPEETPYIESGRGSGKFPPVKKIREWVDRKFPSETLPRKKSLAFLIGRKISEDGTDGKHKLFDIIDRMNGKYELMIFDALKDDVNYHISSLEVKLNKIFSKL